MTSQSRIRKVTDKALDAFWSVVAEQFPNAQTGDCSPQTTIALDEAARFAIHEWIAANCPEGRTPGPWHVTVSQNPDVYGGEEHFAIIADHQTSHGQILADVETLPGAKANATLIAACPELLLACKQALKVIDELDCASSLNLMCLVDTLRTAITDAEGSF